MRGMEMMIGTILQQMGVDPEKVKASIESTVSELKIKVDEINQKLAVIDTRAKRIEIKLGTLPLEEVVSDAQFHGVLTDGRNSHNDSNGRDAGNGSHAGAGIS